MAELKMDFEKIAEGFLKTAKESGMFIGWWIPCCERLPKKNGQYFVTTTSALGTPMIIIRSFAQKLSRVDPYDFMDAKGCGWYDYNSEFGYWQDTGVKAWMPLPEPYKMCGDRK